MSRFNRAVALGFCVASSFGGVALDAGRGRAEPPTTALTTSTLENTTRSIARFKVDASGKPAFLARFSDGPRNVPLARGAAKERAERLGIGGLDVSREFLWTRPSPELLAEVKGESPKNLLWPVVDGHFGRGFGFTRTLRPELAHNGIDIGAKEGAVVRAAADGLVIYSDNGLTGYGNCVMILHANGWMTLYAHNLRTTVQPGWRVKRGERIGLVGQTGYAWGPHLHFELRDNGKLRNPEPLITGWRSDEVNGPLVMLEGELPPVAAAVQAALKAAADREKAEAKPVTADNSAAKKSVERAADAEAAPAPKAMAKPEAEPVVDSAAEDDAFAPVEHFLRDAPSEAERARARGRLFRNLLWPVKGGVARARGARFELDAEAGAAVRAAADGVVVYSGQAPRGYTGDVVVVLHGNGWVTTYAGATQLAVKPGDQVQRGQWIAHTGAKGEALRFEWRIDGKPQDRDTLRASFVGAP